MNDTLLARELAVMLKADAGFLALLPQIHGEQSGFVCEPPSLILFGEYTPYTAARKGLFKLEVRSRMANAGNHDERCRLVWNKFLGGPGADLAASRENRAAAKAEIIAAVNAQGNVTLLDYGAAAPAWQTKAVNDDLVSILGLRVAWRFRSI